MKIVGKIELTAKYPESAIINNIEGVVKVMFNIDASCQLNHITIIDSIGYGCEKAAIEDIKKMVNDYKTKKNNKWGLLKFQISLFDFVPQILMYISTLRFSKLRLPRTFLF